MPRWLPIFLFSCFLMAPFSGCVAITYGCQLVSIKNSTPSTEWPILHSLWQLMHYIPTVKQFYYNSWIVVLSFYLSLLRVIEKWSQLRHRAEMDVEFGPCLYQSDLTLQLFICVITVFRSSWHGAAAMLLQHQEDFFFVSFLSSRIYSLRQTDRQSGGSKRQISHFPAVSCQNCQLSCVRHSTGPPSPGTAWSDPKARRVSASHLHQAQPLPPKQFDGLPWLFASGNVRAGGCCFSLGKART